MSKSYNHPFLGLTSGSNHTLPEIFLIVNKSSKVFEGNMNEEEDEQVYIFYTKEEAVKHLLLWSRNYAADCEIVKFTLSQ